MPLWHLMSFEQARMKMIDGTAVTHPGLAPDYLMLVQPGSTLEQISVEYQPTQEDVQRTDWEMRIL